jgi:tRNA (cytidine/uridine-2'-O-)-methyltransferase
VFHVVLVEPEIPANTGNVIRLCANTGARLHLVAPLGFSLEDKQLRRAGLDYHDLAEVRVHASWGACAAALRGLRSFAFSSRAARPFHEVRYKAGDVLVFGREADGLPPAVMAQFPQEQRLRLPMRAGNRSLNLSNGVAVAVYEAWRQCGFEGAALPADWLPGPHPPPEIA